MNKPTAKDLIKAFEAAEAEHTDIGYDFGNVQQSFYELMNDQPLPEDWHNIKWMVMMYRTGGWDETSEIGNDDRVLHFSHPDNEDIWVHQIASDDPYYQVMRMNPDGFNSSDLY